jgi:hypothetical protein
MVRSLRRLTEGVEEESQWKMGVHKVPIGEYLSWVVKQPLLPWLFLIGGHTFCHLMPHCGSHVRKHIVQPYFYLKEEL